MKPEQIATLIDDHKDSEDKYDPREIQRGIVESYTTKERNARDWQAARRELWRFEKANKASHDLKLFEPNSIVVLGDNDRVLMGGITPRDADKRMKLVIQKAAESLTASTKEITYYQHYLDRGWESGGLGKFIEQQKEEPSIA